MAFRPQVGDVVVRSCARVHATNTLQFLLRTYGDDERFAELTYDRALERAVSLGRELDVDVWLTEDDVWFRRVSRHRLKAAC